MSSNCPVCNKHCLVIPGSQKTKVNCHKCGTYLITKEALSEVELLTCQDIANIPPLLSHNIRKRIAYYHDNTIITAEWVQDVVRSQILPNPPEQADLFILWLGQQLEAQSDKTNVVIKDFESVASIIGAFDGNSVQQLLLVHMVKMGWVSAQIANFVILTFEGWRRYQELLKGHTDSRYAFMAMPFGFSRLNEYFEKFYIPAVASTGFKLERVDSNPGAGSITNRMLVEIRRSKFLLCELTHNNNGAYWEAGYAEGLGKPVIYLCEKDPDTHKLHFDIRNNLTVFWTEDSLPEAMEDLKAAIRATFPDEAILEDRQVEAEALT